MHAVRLPADPQALSEFEAEWNELTDDSLIEVFHLIDSIKTYGLDPDRRGDTLDGFLELYAVPIKGVRLKLMLSLDTREKVFTLLGFTGAQNWSPHAFRLACRAHRLIAPAREPVTARPGGRGA